MSKAKQLATATASLRVGLGRVARQHGYRLNQVTFKQISPRPAKTLNPEP